MKAGTGMTRLIDGCVLSSLKGTRQTFGVMAVVPDPERESF
jgi:hypothetical protein